MQDQSCGDAHQFANNAPATAYGIVGIFDALGAKDFGPAEVASFIDAQREILAAVASKAADQTESRGLEVPKLFTFNDTIAVALKTNAPDESNAIKGFAKIARRFISYSLTKGLLFRGAFSIGDYVVSEAQNLIMGSAVTDAASWFEQFELIGAFATPKASMTIRRHILLDSKPPDFLLFEADIPSKRGSLKLYAANWPKAFYVTGLRPADCEKGRELPYLLQLLAANEVPIGTEHKYKNTVDFFMNAPCQQAS